MIGVEIRNTWYFTLDVLCIFAAHHLKYAPHHTVWFLLWHSLIIILPYTVEVRGRKRQFPMRRRFVHPDLRWKAPSSFFPKNPASIFDHLPFLIRPSSATWNCYDRPRGRYSPSTPSPHPILNIQALNVPFFFSVHSPFMLCFFFILHCTSFSLSALYLRHFLLFLPPICRGVKFTFFSS